MKVAVIGSRGFDNYSLLKKVMNKYAKQATAIVSGGAKGADTLAERYAQEFNLEKIIFLADWGNIQVSPCIIRNNSKGPYNAMAGHNRNTKIVESADLIIAFWDFSSKGTRDSLKKAHKMGKKTIIINYKKNKNIVYMIGDIFNSQCEVLVNPVNCVGVMGAGLALSFKERYPNMFSKYKSYCTQGLLSPGKIALIQEDTKRIMLFPTKEHYSKPSKMIYIQEGLAKVKGAYANKGIKSIAFPKLGCGLGGLDWKQVEKEIISALGEENLLVEIYI